MKLVLCAGVFDLFHIGHLRHLQEARSLGDMLVVGVTMDEYVDKPGRPIIPAVERLELMKSLRCVSAAALVRDSVEALHLWKPHIYVKGHDYIAKGLLNAEHEACAKYHTVIRHTKEQKQTTTKIIERIRNA